MEKETFIYKGKLEDVAGDIYEKYGIRIAFCEIFGKRWSWFAGNGQCFISQKRMKISEDLGVIVEENGLEEGLIDELKTGIACSLASL